MRQLILTVSFVLAMSLGVQAQTEICFDFRNEPVASWGASTLATEPGARVELADGLEFTSAPLEYSSGNFAPLMEIFLGQSANGDTALVLDKASIVVSLGGVPLRYVYGVFNDFDGPRNYTIGMLPVTRVDEVSDASHDLIIGDVKIVGQPATGGVMTVRLKPGMFSAEVTIGGEHMSFSKICAAPA